VHALLLPQSLSRAEAVESCRRYLQGRLRRFGWIRPWLPAEGRDEWITLLAWQLLTREIGAAQAGFERRRALEELQSELDAALDERAASPIGIALSFAIRRHQLPGEVLRRPLLEHRRDESLATFETREALLAHARALAVPEGRLLLRLAGLGSPRDEVLCDALAVALQLTSWLVDLAAELERGRLRLPMDELARAGVALQGLLEGQQSERLAPVVAAHVVWARGFYAKGWDLCRSLGPWRGRKLAFYLRWNAASLTALEAARFDPARGRPREGWLRLGACLAASLSSRGMPRFA